MLRHTLHFNLSCLSSSSAVYANSLLAARKLSRGPAARALRLTTLAPASLSSRKVIAETSHVYTEADGPFGTVYAISGPEPSARRAHGTRPAGNEEWELRQVNLRICTSIYAWCYVPDQKSSTPRHSFALLDGKRSAHTVAVPSCGRPGWLRRG